MGEGLDANRLSKFQPSNYLLLPTKPREPRCLCADPRKYRSKNSGLGKKKFKISDKDIKLYTKGIRVKELHLKHQVQLLPKFYQIVLFWQKIQGQ